MLRNIFKQAGEAVESVLKKKRKAMAGGFAEKEDYKPGMKEWRVMDDESGESMELMEEVLGESKLEKLVCVWQRSQELFQKRGEAYWKEWSIIRREDAVDGQVWPKMKCDCCEEAELWWG